MNLMSLAGGELFDLVARTVALTLGCSVFRLQLQSNATIWLNFAETPNYTCACIHRFRFVCLLQIRYISVF